MARPLASLLAHLAHDLPEEEWRTDTPQPDEECLPTCCAARSAPCAARAGDPAPRSTRESMRFGQGGFPCVLP